MTRRQVLQAVAVLLGGVVSSSLVSGVLGCRPRRLGRGTWRPRTLTPEQGELVATIAERILPATDTPGAREAGVHEFIDLLLTEWRSEEERDRFLAGLAQLDADSRQSFGEAFLSLTAEQQLTLLDPLDVEAARVRQAAAATGLEEIDDPSFFLMMKEMTLAGYYTSEIGMTQELQHLRVAGSYAGCRPLSEVGRSWA